MSFRKPKPEARRRSNDWYAWIDLHRNELMAIGLPPEVYLDESHWSDFLQNGHMHWHQSSGFDFDQLSPGQLAALHRFLEREYGTRENWPLLDWVRVRCRAV
jgi:hypothetical protein